MRLNIRLPDEKYCNSCPCFGFNYREERVNPCEWICRYYKRTVGESYGTGH